MSTEKKVTITSYDGESFNVDEAVVCQFMFFKEAFEDGAFVDGLTLPEVNGKILAKVIEYCKKHVENPKGDDPSAAEELKNWDAEFVKVDQVTLFEIILAANYLEIETLLELTSQTVADMFKGKTLDDIRATFNIKNDFTPQEEEKLRKENHWVFE